MMTALLLFIVEFPRVLNIVNSGLFVLVAKNRGKREEFI